MSAPASPWWAPARHADRRPALLARNRIKNALIDWFARENFVAAETSALQVSPGIETHLHAFATQILDEAGNPFPLYLHTSPEFAMKKLLAAGEERLYDFARVFRNRTRDALHAPEFTMLEWYRAGAPISLIADDAIAVLRVAARAADARTLRYRDRACDPLAEPERLSVADAFRRHAGIDILASLAADGTSDRAVLARDAAAAGIRIAGDDTWSDIFSRVLSERVEPHLGIGRPTLLGDYPLPEAALARPCAADPRLAERFELYACGVELANAFAELTDPVEQRRRFAADLAEKTRIYGETYPIDEDFLAALATMPAASGAALGFDRLVMLVLGAPNIEAVQWTPVADPFG
ncbi:MAG: EF-P lysine aminoacylase EpmA [Bauldia sp.]